MKIMVIDGNSIINRAFYGIRLMTNKDGLYTNAVYGFLSTLTKLQSDENPDRIIVCFDRKEKTFRHEKFDTYKATRKGMPEELAVQLPVLKELIDAMGITRCELAGFEADDLIGTISREANENGDKCIVVSGDRDNLQLASHDTIVKLITTKEGHKNYDFDAFVAEYGFEPMKLVDLKSLMGDSSDNIKGVAGIGEKTAKQLIADFGSLDGIYANIDDKRIKKGAREKLISGETDARDSFWLATIERHAPLPLDTKNIPELQPDNELIVDMLTKLQFQNFLKKMNLQSETKIENTMPESTAQTINIVDFNIATKKINMLSNNSYISIFTTSTLSEIGISTQNYNYTLLEKDFTYDEWTDILKKLFESKIEYVMHDAKECIVSLLERSISPKSPIFDTCIAAYLLNASNGNYDISRIIFTYCGRQINELAPNQPIDTEILPIYSRAIFDLHENLSNELQEKKMKNLYFDIELPLMIVLAEMQFIGVSADIKLLREFGENLDIRTAELTEKIYEHAGETFNINSTQRLGFILFEKLGLPMGKKTKTGYSTNADVLESLVGYHEIVSLVLEYRKLAKLKSTYVDGLLKVISPKDGRIHSHFQQTVTATGRLSSTDPNIQNIPVRTPIGRELRHVFMAKDENHVLIDADYSQIELRVLAHIANDTEMIKAFNDGLDIHKSTAAQVFHVPLEDVTPEMRSSCKAVNFGIVYGISEFSLSQDIGVTRKEAGEYIRKYLDTYSGVRQYMEDSKQYARDHGFVETLFGRRRYIPEINATNFNVRSFNERIAMNTPIQGTAADIIKIAMVRVANRLKKENLHAKLILQVHDELIIEAPMSEKDTVIKLLEEEMQSAMQMTVPLIAEANFGKDWFECH